MAAASPDTDTEQTAAKPGIVPTTRPSPVARREQIASPLISAFL
ncbi:hypothetical protein BH10CYA1_BH10CYA1_57880 [soil metagenome]